MSLFGYADPAQQAFMVLDRVRTEAYARAIAAVVTPGDVVLDIGTGSGVLALLAAKAGARKVYAVERSKSHALARAHVSAAGLDDVVEVIHRDLLDIDALPSRPTVVLGEQLGHFAPDENMHALYRHAMTLAVEGARVIPASYALTFALADLRALRDDLDYLDHALPVKLEALSRGLLRRPRLFAVPRDALLGPEATGETIAVTRGAPTRFPAELAIDRDGAANALVVAFRAALCADVSLDTSASAPSTHWRQVVFPFESLRVEAGERVDVVLEPRVLSSLDAYRWQVRSAHGTRDCDGLDAHGELTPLEFARALGLVPRSPAFAPSRTLQIWASALGGDANDDFDVLLGRAMRAMPDVEEREAREALVSLLTHAGALAPR